MDGHSGGGLRPTLVVNVIGGPASGKTSAATEIAEVLRNEYLLEVELVSPYGNELARTLSSPLSSQTDRTRAERLLDGAHQAVIMQESQRRTEICLGRADVVVREDPPIGQMAYVEDSEVPELHYGYLKDLSRAVECHGMGRAAEMGFAVSTFDVLVERAPSRAGTPADVVKDDALEALVDAYLPGCFRYDPAEGPEFIVDCIANGLERLCHGMGTEPPRAVGLGGVDPALEATEERVRSACAFLGDGSWYNPVTGVLVVAEAASEPRSVTVMDTLPCSGLVAALGEMEAARDGSPDIMAYRDAYFPPFDPAVFAADTYTLDTRADRSRLLATALEIASQPDVWVDASLSFSEVAAEAVGVCAAYERIDPVSARLMSDSEVMAAQLYLGPLGRLGGRDPLTKEWEMAEHEMWECAKNTVAAEMEHRGLDPLGPLSPRFDDPTVLEGLASRGPRRTVEDALEAAREVLPEGFESTPDFALMLDRAGALGWLARAWEGDVGSAVRLELRKSSPLGEDYSIELDIRFEAQADDFEDGLYRYVEMFSPDSHAAMWVESLDFNGRSVSVADLAEDAEAICEMNYELSREVSFTCDACRRWHREALLPHREDIDLDAPASALAGDLAARPREGGPAVQQKVNVVTR